MKAERNKKKKKIDRENYHRALKNNSDKNWQVNSRDFRATNNKSKCGQLIIDCVTMWLWVKSVKNDAFDWNSRAYNKSVLVWRAWSSHTQSIWFDFILGVLFFFFFGMICWTKRFRSISCVSTENGLLSKDTIDLNIVHTLSSYITCFIYSFIHSMSWFHSIGYKLLSTMIAMSHFITVIFQVL